MFKQRFRFLDQNFRLSITAFYFYIPTSILSVPILFWEKSPPASLLELIVVGILITGLTFGVYWILIVACNQMIRVNHFVIGATILIVTGVTRGVSVFAIFDFLGYSNPTSLLERTINSTFNVFVWLGVGSIVIESNRRFTRRYRALMTQILVLKLRKGPESENGYAYIAQAIQQLQGQVTRALEKMRTSDGDSKPEEVISKTLRKEIEEELRPLSQRLLIKSIYDPPTLRFKLVFLSAITELEFKSRLIASIYAGSFVLNTVFLINPLLALFNGFLNFFIFLVVAKMRDLLLLHFHSKKALINVLFLLAIGFVVGMACTFILDSLGLDHSYLTAILIAPILTVIILVSSFLKLAFSDRQKMLGILSKKSKMLDGDFVNRINRGNAASYIHNSLQSELTSMVYQLEAVAKSPDPIKSKLVMERLESFISRSRSEEFENFLETPELRLARVSQSWEGLVDLRMKFDDGIFEDQGRATLVVQLIEESVANSVRSGMASEVVVTGQFSGDSVKIIVWDNGKAPISNRKWGFGSKWIESIALSHWALEESDIGRTLTVEL